MFPFQAELPHFVDQITVGDLAIWIGVLAAAIGFVKKVWPAIRALGHLADDVRGEPERPGVPARPGLMERIAAVEKDAALAAHNTRPNGGQSSHDRIMAQLTTISTQQTLQAESLAEHIRLSTEDRAELRELVEANGEAIEKVNEAITESRQDRKHLHSRIDKISPTHNQD